jgi:hypothetical protein
MARDHPVSVSFTVTPPPGVGGPNPSVIPPIAMESHEEETKGRWER